MSTCGYVYQDRFYQQQNKEVSNLLGFTQGRMAVPHPRFQTQFGGIFKRQAVREEETNRLSRNVGTELSLYAA
jgi:hypothetical protein